MNLVVDHVHLTPDQCQRLKSQVVNETEQLKWGTYGPEGRGPLRMVYLIDLDTDHLENILITQPHISNRYAAAILQILKCRYLASRSKVL